jgi:hypothetical protein
MMDDDLKRACMAALKIDRSACHRFAEGKSWRRSTEQFLALLAHRSGDVGAARTSPGMRS